MSANSVLSYPSGIYNGRLEADGDGNLLASEGEFAGFPVAYHDGSFIFVQPGELSHNERHHVQFAQSMQLNGETSDLIGGTVDESQIPEGGDPTLINVGDGVNEHHFSPSMDDPHYLEGATDDFGRVTNTKTKTIPDAMASRITGHTASVSTDNAGEAKNE